MKGTTPFTPLSQDFRRRMLQIDPNLVDFNYGGEAYDAVAVAGLAAEAAHSTDAAAIAKYIVPVTTGSNRCDSLKVCLQLIRSGKDIAYRGVSLARSGLTDAGEPSTASYGVLSFGRNNHIDEGRTEYVGAGKENGAGRGALPAKPPAGYRPIPPLRIGGLLSRTGRLGFASAPAFAGAQLAVAELNAEGGVLDSDVEWLDGDDGTSVAVATATLDRHIAAGAQVIIGATSSGVSEAVLPRAIAAGRVMISPSATSDGLSTVPDSGLFFRTAPPDILQSQAIADVVMRDGTRRLAIIARDDGYGHGLATTVRDDLVRAGQQPADVKVFEYASKESYDATEEQTAFNKLGQTVKTYQPDAALVIGYDESALAIKGMLTAGIRIGT